MKLSGAAKRMITVISISFVFLAVGGFIAHIAYFSLFLPLPFAVGAFLGCTTSALKVVMLDLNATKALQMDAVDAKNYIGLWVFGRFILTGAVLALAAINQYVSLWGTAAGILTLQVAAISMRNYVDSDEHPQKVEN